MNNFDTNEDLPRSTKYDATQMHQAETLMNGEHALTPKMVSSLLNVNVLLQSEHMHKTENKEETFSVFSAILMFFLAIAIAAAAGTALLYVYEIGPFYNLAEVAEGI